MNSSRALFRWSVCKVLVRRSYTKWNKTSSKVSGITTRLSSSGRLFSHQLPSPIKHNRDGASQYCCVLHTLAANPVHVKRQGCVTVESGLVSAIALSEDDDVCVSTSRI